MLTQCRSNTWGRREKSRLHCLSFAHNYQRIIIKRQEKIADGFAHFLRSTVRIIMHERELHKRVLCCRGRRERKKKERQLIGRIKLDACCRFVCCAATARNFSGRRRISVHSFDSIEKFLELDELREWRRRREKTKFLSYVQEIKWKICDGQIETNYIYIYM